MRIASNNRTFDYHLSFRHEPEVRRGKKILRGRVTTAQIIATFKAPELAALEGRILAKSASTVCCGHGDKFDKELGRQWALVKLVRDSREEIDVAPTLKLGALKAYLTRQGAKPEVLPEIDYELGRLALEVSQDPRIREIALRHMQKVPFLAVDIETTREITSQSLERFLARRSAK